MQLGTVRIGDSDNRFAFDRARKGDKTGNGRKADNGSKAGSGRKTGDGNKVGINRFGGFSRFSTYTGNGRMTGESNKAGGDGAGNGSKGSKDGIIWLGRSSVHTVCRRATIRAAWLWTGTGCSKRSSNSTVSSTAAVWRRWVILAGACESAKNSVLASRFNGILQYLFIPNPSKNSLTARVARI